MIVPLSFRSPAALCMDGMSRVVSASASTADGARWLMCESVETMEEEVTTSPPAKVELYNMTRLLAPLLGARQPSETNVATHHSLWLQKLSSYELCGRCV